MSLYYKVMSTKNPGKNGNGEEVWFPKLTGSSQVNLRDLCELMEKRSTLSGADIVGVMYSLVSLIPELLCNGKTIKIDGFGTFRLHAKVETSKTEAEVSVRNIKEYKLSFTPDKIMKVKLKEAKATKQK